MQQVMNTNGTPVALRRGNACLKCRKKKTKCDGLKPICTPCIKGGRHNGIECHYDQVQKKKTRDQILAAKVLALEKRLGLVDPNVKGSDDEEESDDSEKIAQQPQAQAQPSTSLSPSSHSAVGLPGTPPLTFDFGFTAYQMKNLDLELGLTKDPSVSDADAWWDMDELPLGIRDYLITIFLDHAAQVHFEPHTSSFLNRLNLYPPAHPLHPHPSLMNAIYLFATFYLSVPSHPCHNVFPTLDPSNPYINLHPPAFGSPGSRAANPWSRPQLAFLDKARNTLGTNLAMAENLFDFFIASGLLARYYYYNGRRGEGYNQANGAMRLAIACNLHLVSSPHVVGYFPPSMLHQPTTLGEVRERLDSFWNTFMLDRYGSLCSGLCTSFPDEKITTIFPPQMPQFSPVDPSPEPIWSFDTVSSLYESGSRAANMTNDSTHTMHVKISALTERVRRMIISVTRAGAKSIREAEFDLATEYHATDAALNQMIDTLPLFPPPPSSNFNNASPTTLGTNGGLALAHTVLRGDLILLCAPFSLTDLSLHAKAVKAAKEIVTVAKGLVKISEIWWHLPINMGWVNACDTFHQEIARLKAGARPLSDADLGIGTSKLPTKTPEATIASIKKDMEFLLKMMNKLITVYHGHKGSADSIEDWLLAI